MIYLRILIRNAQVMSLHKIISTLGLIGFSKIAPGTVASLATSVFSYFILKYFNIYFAIFFFILSITFGFYSTHKYLVEKKISDPKEVVIDEFAGQILAIIISYFFVKNIDNKNLLIIICVNFLLFRLFDITKIFPVSYFDNIDNAFGVMFDDIVAGIMAAMSFVIIFRFVL
jgi:phosphatidylglycerophosphatase A